MTAAIGLSLVVAPARGREWVSLPHRSALAMIGERCHRPRRLSPSMQSVRRDVGREGSASIMTDPEQLKAEIAQTRSDLLRPSTNPSHRGSSRAHPPRSGEAVRTHRVQLAIAAGLVCVVFLARAFGEGVL